jgi:hypothetical protein
VRPGTLLYNTATPARRPPAGYRTRNTYARHLHKVIDDGKDILKDRAVHHIDEAIHTTDRVLKDAK